MMALGAKLLTLSILIHGTSLSVAMANNPGFSTELLDQIQRIEAAITYEIPQLPEPAKQNIEEAEERIDMIIGTTENVTPQELKATLNAAEEIVKTRQQHQGLSWWETIGAQQRLLNVQRWAHFTTKERATWTQSFSLDLQASRLKRDGKFQEAQQLYEQSLTIRENLMGHDHLTTASSLNNLAELYSARGQYTRAQPLFQRALTIVEKSLGHDHPNTATSLNHLATLYKAQGQYTQAQPLLQRVLKIVEKSLGLNHPNTLTTLNNLAELHQTQGQYAQAQPLYERVLAIQEKVLGPEHYDTAKSLSTLAALYEEQGNHEPAKLLYKRTLKIIEKVRGPEHPDTGTALNNLAKLYFKQGQYAQALPLFQRALVISEKTMGPNHLDTAITLNNLAALYEAQGQYSQAQPLAQRALTITEHNLGNNHPATATRLNNLAMLYEAQGQYSQAQLLSEQALAILENTLGPDHPNTALIVNNLASVYEAQGQYAKARPLYEQALRTAENTLGPDHPNTATSLGNLAVLYKMQGQYTQALSLYQRALAIQEKALGPNHPDTGTSLHNLASVYEAQGQSAKARPLYEQALRITENTLGPDHPNTAVSLGNLAKLYTAQGEYAQGLPLAQRALAIKEKALGPDHPNTAESLNNLAMLHEQHGNYAAARPLYERALAIHEKVLGLDHPSTAASLGNLGRLYQGQGQYTQALSLYQRALAIREKALGPNHPATGTSLNDLALLYQSQKQNALAQPLFERALTIAKQVLGPDHPETAVSLNNLALLYMVQGQYTQAMPLFEQALAIWRKAQQLDQPEAAAGLHNLALLSLVQGEYPQAQLLWERALRIFETVLGANHPDTASVVQDLAIVKLAVQPNEAIAQLLLRSSQSKWQYLTNTFPTLPTAAQRQFFAKSDLQTTPQYFWPLFTALPELDRAVGFQATLLSKQLVAEATRQESSAQRQVLANAPPAWRALWQQREDRKRQYAARALRDLQEDPARPRRATQQSTQHPISLRDLSDQIDQLDQQLRRDHPAYAAQAQLEQISVEQVRAALRPHDLLLEYVQFRSYDRQTKKLTDTVHYGVYVVRGDGSPIVAIDLGEAAPIDAAIRQYHEGQRAVRDLVNSGEAPKLRVLQQSEATLAGLSSRIRTAIWQPLAPHLRGVTRVYVAPDGQLSQFPFEVLAQQTKKHKTKQRWTYLVEEKELVYLNTGRDLARLAATTGVTNPSTSASKQAVLIGNPAFYALPPDVARAIAALPASTPTVVAQSDPSGKAATLGLAETSPRLEVPRRWDDRPELGTLLHASNDHLTRHGWTVTMLEQQQAVEEAVLRVQAPQLLQLATHGYRLDPAPDTQRGDNPLLRSMLLFSGVNQADPQQTVFYRLGQDLLSEAEAQQRGLSAEALRTARIEIGDGILTAYEVTGMNLQGTELVNLTACETGLGQVTSDGVMGLRQAFLLAGARALTLSMWEVPAEETTKQIAAFYQRWLGAAKDSKKNSNNKKRTTSLPALTRYGAFRQTQLAALDAARAHRKGVGHPFFWAGTIYLGDPGDLPSASPRQLSSP